MALGKLQGTKMVELFRDLVDSRTIISMLILGSRFERLTCVTEVRDDGKQVDVIVDLPDGFKAQADKHQPLKLRFNFNGPDRLEYIFTTQGGIYDGDGLRVPLPEYVERLQRRKDFRQQVPMRSHMNFQAKQLKGTVELINISLGGAYGVIRPKDETISKRPVLKVKQPIFKISLVFPGLQAAEGENIQIKKAEVVRIEQNKENYKHKYAFEFKHIDKEEKQKLVEYIYHLQREYLKRR